MAEPIRRKPRSRTRRAAPQPSARAPKTKPQASTRRQTLDALQESERRFRTLAECAPVVVWMTDADYRSTYISGYWREFTGRDPEKDLGFAWVEALHPDDREQVVRSLKEARQSLAACQGEYRVRRANGTIGWLYYHGVPHLHADGTYAGHIGTCIDITHHKAHEQAQVEVQKGLVLGQEAERKRVAGELHDDIVQKLALVGLRLREVQISCEPSSELEETLKALRHQVQSIAVDVHRISHDLHPAAITHLGLVTALRRLCREFSTRTRIAIDFTSDPFSFDAPAEVGIAIYRVTQECLTNIHRHSRSPRANVALKECEGVFRLTISDAGVGFEQDQRPPSTGIGLLGIRERARMIGANVEITSAPLKGTKVELSVPMAILTGVGQISDGVPPSGV